MVAKALSQTSEDRNFRSLPRFKTALASKDLESAPLHGLAKASVMYSGVKRVVLSLCTACSG